MTKSYFHRGWLIATATALFVLTGCQAGFETSAAAHSSSVARGEYLVNILACDDCHTPWVMGPAGPEPDMSRRLTGHPAGVDFEIPELPEDGAWWVGSATNTAYAGPWGVSYSANLTPDENTGLGIWTEKMFVDAIRTGRHMGTSRMIQPPMPWPAFAKMTDEDLTAVYAFLRSLPPMENRVAETLNAEELQVQRLAARKKDARRGRS